MSAMTIHPSNKVDCRYCHAIDHVKGHFDKNRKQYVTLCPKLLAKAMRESGRTSLRRQASQNVYLQRKTAAKNGEWIDVTKSRPTRKATSPGPRITGRKSFNFEVIESVETSSANRSKQLPPLGKWTNKLALKPLKKTNNNKIAPSPKSSLQPDTEFRAAPVVVSKDALLKNKKRLNRIAQLKAEIAVAREDLEEEEQNAISWADEGDIDDARLRLECLEEKLERIQ